MSDEETGTPDGIAEGAGSTNAATGDAPEPETAPVAYGDGGSGRKLVIHIEYEAKDFADVARALLWRTPVMYVTALIMTVGSVALVWYVFNNFAWIFGVAALIGVVIGNALAVPMTSRRIGKLAEKNYESSEALQHPLTWTLSATSIEVRGKGLEAKRELNGFSRVLELEKGFVLWQSLGAYNYLPKRFLQSDDDLRFFRETIRQGLPGTAKVKLRDN